MLRITARLTAALVAISICIAPIASAQEAAKADMKDILRLMDLSGSTGMGSQMMDQMLGSFQQNMPTVPQKFWDDFRTEVDANEIVELIAPVYAKHFNASDVAALIKFYESPVGRKLMKSQPAILQESMAIGQQYSQDVATKLMQKLKAEGHTP